MLFKKNRFFVSVFISLFIIGVFIVNQDTLNEKEINDLGKKNMNPISNNMNILFSDDFESGTTNWIEMSGYWHLTNASTPYSDSYRSYESAMWFGKDTTGDFSNGSAQSSGNLISRPIDIQSMNTVNLTFFHWFEGEAGEDYDVPQLFITDDGGASWTLLKNYTDSKINPWQKEVFDITPFLTGGSIQIKFRFDSRDDVSNDGRGWIIDDIEILELLPLNPDMPKNPAPYNGEVNVLTDPIILSVYIEDPDSDYLEVSFYDDGLSDLIGKLYNQQNGTYASIEWYGPSSGGNTYHWYVEVFDGENKTTSPVWHFTTINDPYENNDFKEDAYNLNYNQQDSHEDSNFDDDWFKLQLWAGMELNVELEHDKYMGGINVAIFDRDGVSILAHNGDYSNFKHIFTEIQYSGEYYIYISGDSMGNSYNLSYWVSINNCYSQLPDYVDVCTGTILEYELEMNGVFDYFEVEIIRVSCERDGVVVIEYKSILMEKSIHIPMFADINKYEINNVNQYLIINKYAGDTGHYFSNGDIIEYDNNGIAVYIYNATNGVTLRLKGYSNLCNDGSDDGNNSTTNDGDSDSNSNSFENNPFEIPGYPTMIFSTVTLLALAIKMKKVKKTE